MRNVSPERLFLNYASPCLETRKGREQVLPEHEEKIRQLVAEGIERPPRKLLRYVFPNAYRGMRQAAQELGIEPWSAEAIRHYFLERHNEHVEVGRGKIPEKLLERCRIAIGRVVEDKGTTAIVNFGKKTEEVIKNGKEPIREGTRVATHYRQIVDVFEE